MRGVREKYATGSHGYWALVNALNARGVPARTETGRWTTTVMQYLIKNRFYAGEVRYKPRDSDEITRLPGQHEAIVSRELFDQVAAVCKKRAYARRRYGHNKHTYLLSGLAHCHLCGFSLRASFRQEGSYLRERSEVEGYDCPAGRRSVPVAMLDPQVEEIVR